MTLLIVQTPALAYQTEAAYKTCSKAVLYSRGYSSPGSAQKHTHSTNTGTTRWYQFPPVYGAWYAKTWTGNFTSANWQVEALDNGGAKGYINFTETYGYCVA